MRVASIVFSCFAIVLLTVSPINAAAVALYPRDIRGAYNVNPLLQSGYTGKGVTVAIVNTGIDGTFYTSVKGFSSVYGLPDPTISVVRPYGSAGTDHETPDGETTADAELVHAMAPDAHILLVLLARVVTCLMVSHMLLTITLRILPS